MAKKPTSLLKLVTDACKSLLQQDSFWLIAGMSDTSFEVGNAASYADFVSACHRSILNESVLEQLRPGINGNLVRQLRKRTEGKKSGVIVSSPQARGPDILIRRDGDTAAKMEVKQTWEFTLPKYYLEIAEDRNKLHSERASGFSGELFQIVFLLELPNYRYPEARWYGHSHSIDSRPPPPTNIRSQWDQVAAHIGHPPAFPAKKPPYVRPLVFPTAEITARDVQEWFNGLCEPVTPPFHFDAASQLRDAAAGVVVWQL
jgi:hypothetical protein